MLIPNTLFRMGGAAMVLTNRMSERWRAKYELQHVVRVHLGADDTAYECVPSSPSPKSKFLAARKLGAPLPAYTILCHIAGLLRVGPFVRECGGMADLPGARCGPSLCCDVRDELLPSLKGQKL